MFKKYYCVKQQDQKDCACACMATISKHYGYKYPISLIRDLASTDKQGTTIFGIVKAAEGLSMSAKAVKVTDKEEFFSDFPLPAIAHVIVNGGLKHFVVIHKITRKEVIVADPGSGIEKYTPEDFFGIWTGILVFVTPKPSFVKGDETKGLFKRFAGLLIPQRALFFNIFIASILITILGIGSAFYFRFITDDVVSSGSKDALQSISIGILVLVLTRIVITAFRSQLLAYLTQKIDIPLMLGYYEHVVNLPMKFFTSREVGEILSRFTDAGQIRSAISGATLTVMIDSIMVVIGAVILYLQNSKLFLLTLIPAFIYLILVYVFKGPREKVNRENMENSAKVNSYLIESINGIETVKAYNAERHVNIETEKRFIKMMKSYFRGSIIENIQSSIRNSVDSIFDIVIIWVGTILVLSGEISLGQLLVFNSLLAYFLSPIENLINLQGTIQTAIIASDRLGEILDLKLEKDGKENAVVIDKFEGNVEFKNVDFRYGARTIVLDDFSISIKPGEKIAFVGESGSGKSTIVKLLMGFYEIEKGGIFIDSYDIRDIDLESLRDRIAYISQENFLFNGSFLDNMKLGNSEITYEEIIEACKKAQIHDFINSQADRYNTIIEENGSNLSGGQKQRLSIARALLKRPDILIMDEATSSLDTITENAITKTLDEISENITTIIIAHRLSTIMRADRIYVLEKGKIVEHGDHRELMKSEGFYYKLWKNQIPLETEDKKMSEEEINNLVNERVKILEKARLEKEKLIDLEESKGVRKLENYRSRTKRSDGQQGIHGLEAK